METTNIYRDMNGAPIRHGDLVWSYSMVHPEDNMELIRAGFGKHKPGPIVGKVPVACAFVVQRNLPYIYEIFPRYASGHGSTGASNSHGTYGVIKMSHKESAEAWEKLGEVEGGKAWLVNLIGG